MQEAQSYPTNLTDAQWELIKDYFNCRRKRKHTIRGVIDAILYVLHSDSNWRMLPKDFAPWQTVYYYYDKWSKSGTWDRVMELLPPEVRPKQYEPNVFSSTVLNWSTGRSAAVNPMRSYASAGGDSVMHPAPANRHIWQMPRHEEEHASSQAA